MHIVNPRAGGEDFLYCLCICLLLSSGEEMREMGIGALMAQRFIKIDGLKLLI